MTTSNTHAAAMVAALGELQNVAKNALNPHFKNKYASLDAILDAVRPILTKHGLALSQEPLMEEGRAGVLTRVIHSSGEARESTLLLPVQQNTAQGIGSAITYARRYAISSILGIAADDDDDGQVASSPPKRFTTAPTPLRSVETKEVVRRAEAEVIGQAGSPVASAPVKKDFTYEEKPNDDLKELTTLMELSGVTDAVVMAFVNRKGANPKNVEYIPELEPKIIKGLVKKWDEIMGSQKEAA
jgi:hypothetical protein